MAITNKRPSSTDFKKNIRNEIRASISAKATGFRATLYSTFSDFYRGFRVFWSRPKPVKRENLNFL